MQKKLILGCLFLLSTSSGIQLHGAFVLRYMMAAGVGASSAAGPALIKAFNLPVPPKMVALASFTANTALRGPFLELISWGLPIQYSLPHSENKDRRDIYEDPTRARLKRTALICSVIALGVSMINQ